MSKLTDDEACPLFLVDNSFVPQNSSHAPEERYKFHSYCEYENPDCLLFWKGHVLRKSDWKILADEWVCQP